MLVTIRDLGQHRHKIRYRQFPRCDVIEYILKLYPRTYRYCTFHILSFFVINLFINFRNVASICKNPFATIHFNIFIEAVQNHLTYLFCRGNPSIGT